MVGTIAGDRRLPPMRAAGLGPLPPSTRIQIMKKSLLDFVHKKDFLNRLLMTLGQFVVLPNDEVEVSVLANKAEVQIVFRIVKGGKKKSNAA